MPASPLIDQTTSTDTVQYWHLHIHEAHIKLLFGFTVNRLLSIVDYLDIRLWNTKSF